MSQGACRSGSSVRAADLTVLTAEDPRTESLDAILATMAAAARAAERSLLPDESRPAAQTDVILK